MKIRTKYQGNQDPFVGDRTLWLRSLPVGANVITATVTLTPRTSSASNDTQYLETFAFSEDNLAKDELFAKKWGITQTQPAKFIEVDFHTRTTLAAVAGTGGNTTLQLDLGGTYVAVASDGTLAPNKGEFPVSLTSAPVVLPGLVVNKFKLTGTTDLSVTKVTIRSLPTNVSVRLGQLAPFWTHLGELSTDDTSPNFATVFNTFLTTAKVQDGFYLIPLVIHSDTIGRLDVELIIDFIIEQAVLPPHLPEIKLAYNFSTLPSVDEALTTLTLPRTAIPLLGRSTAQIIGEFQPSRIAYGNVGEDPINDPSQNPDIEVKVFPECLLAQPLKPGKEIAVTGIDLPLGKTKPGLAGLNLAIQTDADGKPSGEVLTKAEVVVGKPLPNQTNWGSATLPEPFRVEDESDKRYWLVLQSQVGEVDWRATHDTNKNTTGESVLQCSRDGGFSWRVATVEKAPAPLEALFRLRTVPENFTIPVQLQIGKGAQAKRHRLSEFAPLGRIEFRFDFAETLREYLAQATVASPCGSGNLLVNPDFTLPVSDNATYKLFGFGAGRDEASYSSSYQATLEGTVDLGRGVNLSQERFIMLALDDKPPVRIDCAGTKPAQTQLDEIITAINTATRPGVAFEVERNESFTGGLGIRSTIPNMTNKTSVELFTWCNTQLPQGWEGTLGQVFRVRVPEPKQSGRVVVVLAHPSLLAQGICVDGAKIPLSCFPVVPASRTATTDTAISQRFAVVAGCTYLLQFNFQTHNGDDSLAPPRWELVWFDATNATLRTDSEVLEFTTRITSEELTPWLYDTILHPPTGAVQAELRFLHPSARHYPLILEQVSFTPTSATLRNSQFQQWQGESNTRFPVGWTSAGGWVDEERNENGQVIGVKLRGDAPEDTILIQTVKVVALGRYELQVYSHLFPSVSDAETRQIQKRTRIELHWQGSGSVAVPVIIPLDGQDFPTHTWVGTVPEGATIAEIRLIHPQGQAHLLVELVSLSKADVVKVPLIFLAEAPGELTVQNLRIAYDLPAPPLNPSRRAFRGFPTRTLSQALEKAPPEEPVVEETVPPVPQPVTPPPTAPLATPNNVPSQSGVEPPEETAVGAAPPVPPDTPNNPPSQPSVKPPEDPEFGEIFIPLTDITANEAVNFPQLEELVILETFTPIPAPLAPSLEAEVREQRSDNSIDELPLPQTDAIITQSTTATSTFTEPVKHVLEVRFDDLPQRLPSVMRRQRRRSPRLVLVRTIVKMFRKLLKKLVRLLFSLPRSRANASKRKPV